MEVLDSKEDKLGTMQVRYSLDVTGVNPRPDTIRYNVNGLSGILSSLGDVSHNGVIPVSKENSEGLRKGNVQVVKRAYQELVAEHVDKTLTYLGISSARVDVERSRLEINVLYAFGMKFWPDNQLPSSLGVSSEKA